MRTDQEAREQIIEIASDLFAMGHLTATGGNISAKGADADKLWITPSQLYKGSLCAERLLCITANGAVVEGDGVPSVEFRMHWQSYRARPEATAAVHTHSPAAAAFAITNQQFPPVNTDAIVLGDTRTVPWFMPGSQELADAVEEALKVSRGALLQCHGLMAVGKTMHDAAKRAMMLEETAKVLLYCKQFGGTMTVIPDEWVQNLAGIREFL